jgi:hypothetical protein
MIEENPEVTRLVDAVYKLMEKHDRGDTVPYESITAIIGDRPNEGRFPHIMTRVRKRMLANRGIDVWVTPENINVGYRLLTEYEQSFEMPKWRAKKRYRQTRRAMKGVQAGSHKTLSANLRRLRNAQIESLREEVKNDRAYVRSLDKQTTGTPVQVRRPELRDEIQLAACG